MSTFQEKVIKEFDKKYQDMTNAEKRSYNAKMQHAQSKDVEAMQKHLEQRFEKFRKQRELGHFLSQNMFLVKITLTLIVVISSVIIISNF